MTNRTAREYQKTIASKTFSTGKVTEKVATTPITSQLMAKLNKCGGTETLNDMARSIKTLQKKFGLPQTGTMNGTVAKQLSNLNKPTKQRVILSEAQQKDAGKVGMSNKSNIGKYLYAGVEIIGGAITVAASVVAIVGTNGIASPLAYAAAVHGVNSIANGIRDISYIRNGEFNKVGTENYLRDNVYVPVGKGVGFAVGETIDTGVKLSTGKDTNYSKTGSEIGKNFGYIGYYAVDIASGYSSVKKSVSILKDVPKLQSLPLSYYEAGNWLDGYKRMNDLAIWTEGSTAFAKGYAAINGSVNAGSIYYNVNDVKEKCGK